MSISEEMRLDMIERIREELKNVSYPQSFYPKSCDNINCMAYAIGAKVPDMQQNFYFPGGISGNADTLRPTEMVENFIKDMEVLGIQAKVITREQAKEPNQDGIQTVALFYSYERNDFHCIRRDKRNGWSHKLGYENEPKKLAYNCERIFERDDCWIVYDLVAFFNLSSL